MKFDVEKNEVIKKAKSQKNLIIYSIILIIKQLMNILEDLDNYNAKTVNKIDILLEDIYNQLD